MVTSEREQVGVVRMMCADVSGGAEPDFAFASLADV